MIYVPQKEKMNLFGLLDTSGSALTAERIRAEVITANMANSETTRTSSGGPYIRQQVVFKSSNIQNQNNFKPLLFSSEDIQGVNVTAVIPDPAPPILRYDPQHPDANKNGFVAFPDINPLTEMADLISASRAYGLNSSAIQATKAMINSSIEILK